MDAPDKIYVREYDEGIVSRWDRIKQEKSCAKVIHEYIRKDALLGWAKEELERRRNTGDDYFYPAIVMLNDLIDKLNSL